MACSRTNACSGSSWSSRRSLAVGPSYCNPSLLIGATPKAFADLPVIPLPSAIGPLLSTADLARSRPGSCIAGPNVHRDLKALRLPSSRAELASVIRPFGRRAAAFNDLTLASIS